MTTLRAKDNTRLREQALHLLRLQGGVTADELCEALEGEFDDLNAYRLSQLLSHMEQNGLLEQGDKRDHQSTWYVAGRPLASPQPVARSQDGARVMLSEFERQRTPRLATLESRTLVENVVQVWLKPQAGAWFKVPLWAAGVRVCRGRERLHPDQEIYEHIEAVRFVEASGKYQEFPLDVKAGVTLAPME